MGDEKLLRQMIDAAEEKVSIGGLLRLVDFVQSRRFELSFDDEDWDCEIGTHILTLEELWIDRKEHENDLVKAEALSSEARSEIQRLARNKLKEMGCD